MTAIAALKPDAPEWDASPTHLEDALDDQISTLVMTRALSTLSRIAIFGHDFRAEIVPMPVDAPIDEQELAVRNVDVAPLEGVYYAKRNPIELHQYVAGVRFRLDYQAAHPRQGVSDYVKGSMFLTALFERHEKDGYIPGWDGPSMAKALRSVRAVPARKIDAIKRLGNLASHIDAIDYDLLRWFVGEELTLGEIARKLGQSRTEYVSVAIRVALDKAAGHYHLISVSRTSHRNIRE